MSLDTSLFTAYASRVIENCARVIVGKQTVIRHVLVSFICGGHVLLEDVPGTGKTMLLRAFAKTLGGRFSRIQFTPDLLPSDLTGINFFSPKTSEFVFRPGPLFANIVLADEINRATPRTQSSLLEAMEEGQITVDGNTMPLDAPFMVMATQNPLESYGTFPLPEAQIDRFFMRLSLGYMKREQELAVIARPSTLDLVAGLEPAVTAEQTEWVKAHIRQVAVAPEVAGYMMDIVSRTRQESRFVTGVSTRGAIALYKASQAWAAFEGRDFALPEDVQAVAVPVLAHRLAFGGQQSAQSSAEWLQKLMADIPVPMETL